jgi:tRNA-Thr(GGU) m(6)t(6)A37 methyltransferase TsaA
MSDRDERVREGEVVLPFDPGEAAQGPRVVFIGRIRTPWKTRRECPRNIPEARERMAAMGARAEIQVDAPYRPGLEGLEPCADIVVMYWMHESPRHIIIQNPRHIEGTRGVFALRSPVRPNPIALSTVRLLKLDREAGLLTIDAIDCLDGTPLLDIRPWVETADLPLGHPCAGDG